MAYVKNKKQFKIAKILQLAVIFIILALIVLFVLEKKGKINLSPNHINNVKQNKTGPSPDQKKNDDAINAATKEGVSKQEDTQPKSTNPINDANIVELSAKKESNTSVTVFTKLRGISSGNCELTVTNQGRTKTFNAKVFYQSEYSSCAGFSVPVEGLGFGEWIINLKVITPESTVSKSINFNLVP